MIELSLLEQFLAFADTGTLSQAARQLHTSQPALTRSMQKLEQELGVQLFQRSKNHLQLTSTGQHAVLFARRVIQEDLDFAERVRNYDRSLHTISIGYCAPIPQMVLTPVINNLFQGMTLSADMKEDRNFLQKLRDRTYQLAVVHEKPEDSDLAVKKCGQERLFLSIRPSDPLAFYPEIHLKDLDGKAILLLSHIGFWMEMTRQKTPHARYLLQVQPESFQELAAHSDYPCFTSSYFLGRNQNLPGRVNIPLADPECWTDYWLVCLKSEYPRFKELFRQVSEKTIQ